jgi:hypothetical protein
VPTGRSTCYPQGNTAGVQRRGPGREGPEDILAAQPFGNRLRHLGFGLLHPGRPYDLMNLPRSNSGCSNAVSFALPAYVRDVRDNSYNRPEGAAAHPEG